MAVTTAGGVVTATGSPELLKKRWAAPPFGSTTAVKTAYTLGAGAAAGVTAGITSPTYPRNITITGNASGIAGNVVITGTDSDGAALTETIALSGTATVVGNKAFATVTSVDFPAKTNSSGDTVSIGTGAKLGLGKKLNYSTVLAAYINGAREATLPTVALSSSVTAINTITFNTALAGTEAVIFYIADITN
jgi:hypothetical protein